MAKKNTMAGGKSYGERNRTMVEGKK